MALRGRRKDGAEDNERRQQEAERRTNFSRRKAMPSGAQELSADELRKIAGGAPKKAGENPVEDLKVTLTDL
jgi:hypothetical protein